MTDHPSARTGMEIPPDAEPLQQEFRAKAYKANPRLDELADQCAEPATRASVPLPLRGAAAFHADLKQAHDDLQPDNAEGA